MNIKIIKKGTISENKNTSFFQENVQPRKQKIEEKVVQNVLDWVDELRKKKSFEFINAQNFLNGLK